MNVPILPFHEWKNAEVKSSGKFKYSKFEYYAAYGRYVQKQQTLNDSREAKAMNTEHPKAVEAREQAEKRRAEIERAKHTMRIVNEFNKTAKHAAQIHFVENECATICYTRYTEDSAHTTTARVYMMAVALKNPKDAQCKVLGRLVAFDRLRLNNAILIRIIPNTAPKMYFEHMLNFIS